MIPAPFPDRNPRRYMPMLIWLLMVFFFISMLSGRYDISLHDMGKILLSLATNDSLSPALNSQKMVFLWIRLPRCLMAVLVGMGLAVSGAVYQALFRNPLVSPDILGVSAGCTLGAALGIILPGDSIILVQVLSFVCGLLAVSMSLGIARLIAIRPVIVMILAGMVVLSFFNALLMILKYFSDPYDELPSIVFWIMGSLTRVTWTNLATAGPLVCAGIFIILIFRFRLNILSMGDTRATSLGMNPLFFRIMLIILTAVMVSVMVATCGQISWIALIIPHMARSLVGPRHEVMLPVTALLGGIFMLAADGLARSMTAAELPVGIITALTGAPVFGFLLYKNRGSGWL